PSLLSTWITPGEFGSTNRNKYVPAGSVTPGNDTGPLKVKSVLLSTGLVDQTCALAGGATTTASSAVADRINRAFLITHLLFSCPNCFTAARPKTLQIACQRSGWRNAR